MTPLGSISATKPGEGKSGWKNASSLQLTHSPTGKTTRAQQVPTFYFRSVFKGKPSSFTPTSFLQDIFRPLVSISQFHTLSPV